MRLSTALSASLLAVPFAQSMPTYGSPHLSASLPNSNNGASSQDNDNIWQVYSLREQPYQNEKLRFTLRDPKTKYETDCSTGLPMGGYATCEDGKTSFIYGGTSYQYGETWLSIQRRDVEDCSETSTPQPTKRDESSGESQQEQAQDQSSSDQSSEQKQECRKRTAQGTLNLPNNFWQQPGWNSWVHPEELELHWGWSS